jgi:hypothetical protein
MEDIIRSDNSWLWTRLTDEHLDVCLKDFTWMAKSGGQETRAESALTRDQILAERSRRGRGRLINRGTQWPASLFLS